MAKCVELRRHTDNEDDSLSDEGVRRALEIGAGLHGEYDVLVSTGAQRATQTLGCFLAALGAKVPGGVVVEGGLRSKTEHRWKAAYQDAGSGEIRALRAADPELVEEDSATLGSALRRAGPIRRAEGCIVTASTVLAEVGMSHNGAPVAANSHDLEELTRPLLEALATLGSLDSTYLIVLDWDRREQEVRFVHSAGEESITKGSRLPLPDTVFQESLPGVTRSSAQLPETFPDAQAAKHLGLGTYVSVPIVLAKHELYGMLSGASRRAQPVSERLVSAMEFFAQMIAEHVSRTLVAATDQRADLAEEELRAPARFLAIAEHQLKTPLTAIQGAAEVLHARWAALGASTRDQFLDIILRNARVLSTGFTGLLVEARADVRSRELLPEDVDLLDLVQAITRELDAVSTEHQVRAEIELGLTTYADPAALCQVLGHLLDNAVKYSPAKGAITVVGYRTAEGIAVAVVDEGIRLPDGIDIFEAFQRGDSTEVGAAPGIGLGLHIVRNLVEAMGGSVAAQSDAEAGTRFTVNLPMPEPHSGSPSHPSA